MEVERELEDFTEPRPQSADADPPETQEWLDSVDALVDHAGRFRARELMLSVLGRARQRHVMLPGYDGTDYSNTIPVAIITVPSTVIAILNASRPAGVDRMRARSRSSRFRSDESGEADCSDRSAVG